MGTIHQSLEDLGGQHAQGVELPAMALRKNSESYLNDVQSDYNNNQSEYGRQKTLEGGYIGLKGQLKHPIGPAYAKGLKLRGALTIADIPGAQAGSRRHATIRGQQGRMLNPNDPNYVYPGNNELILKVSKNKALQKTLENNKSRHLIMKQKLKDLESVNQGFHEDVGRAQSQSRSTSRVTQKQLFDVKKAKE